MTAKELETLARLQAKWACRTATKREILRCMDLERKRRAQEQSNAH